MNRRMWVFILLLIIGSTIIVTRIFRNGAREEEVREPAERRTFTPATSPSVPKARQSAPAGPATSPTTAAASSQASPSQPPSRYPPAAERAGGACPSCGTETVPGAKFCGECGHRLIS